jgi:pimeloyl-ACP methyl ester carboxylesterase
MIMEKSNTKQTFYSKFLCAIIVLAFLFFVSNVKAQEGWPQSVESNDGTQISYEVYGSGDLSLVFVNGWSCHSRYWKKQVPFFSKDYKIILIDLAGHGHSGMTREKYSMKSFGEDVKAVVEAAGCQNIILIGHSTGGPVIAEASRLMPAQGKGIIGVDTFENIEYPFSLEELNAMMARFRENFQAGTRQFVQQILNPDTNPLLCEWIIADMAAEPQHVGLSSMEESLLPFVTGEAAKIFDDLHIPVYVVKGDLWPVDFEANQRRCLIPAGRNGTIINTAG